MIAKLDGRPANIFDFRTESPRFLGARAIVEMVATERSQGRELGPASKEFASSISEKTANVGAAKGNAAQTEIEELRNAVGEMFPGG